MILDRKHKELNTNQENYLTQSKAQQINLKPSQFQEDQSNLMKIGKQSKFRLDLKNSDLPLNITHLPNPASVTAIKAHKDA